MFTNAYEKRVDPRGKVYYWMAGELVKESEEAKSTDIAAVRNNKISITPTFPFMYQFALVFTAARLQTKSSNSPPR